MTPTPADAEGAPDLAALHVITEAVRQGAGLPAIVRAAAAALDASLVLADRAGSVLAVAARSPAEERSLLDEADGVSTVSLRLADVPVGTLRLRWRARASPLLLSLVATLVASEVERVRAPAQVSQEAAAEFLRGLLDGRIHGREAIVSRGREHLVDLESGGSVIVARAHPQAPAEEGWRSRVLRLAERGARVGASTVLSALSEPAGAGAEVMVLVCGAQEDRARRAAESVLRELQSGLPGCVFCVGRSRVAVDPGELARAGQEARLATNVAEGHPDRPLLAFDDTGAYRLLLGAMSEDPDELRRFFSETVEPLVAYDEQYETELVKTLEAFFEADGNVAGTAQRLFTHRHTVRYRLERVRDLSGLDVGSSDGREKLSLGLKAMCVLGIPRAGGPAREAGAAGGRVPRGAGGPAGGGGSRRAGAPGAPRGGRG